MSCCFPSKADFKPQKANLVLYPDRKLVKSPSPPPSGEKNTPKLREFSLQELREATKDFNRLLLIGEGGFGRVYKGRVLLPNGNGEPTLVAIKKLDKDGVQGRKQWLAEVQFLGTVCHPNLVKLLGYCATETDVERQMQLLLVYEYMPNKSLDQHLFYPDSKTLPWETRLRIMLGAARALAYLHELEIQVIYRDFKSANVLLDKDLRAKLSDFGLAREGPTGDDTHVSTAVVGTCGYAAPEYVGSGRLTSKSDVYSFGVVLYEILTGRRVMDRNRPPAEKKLLLWVKQFPVGSKKFSSIIDPRISNSCSLRVARKIAKLANNCLAQNPRDRPTMSQVIERLKQAIRNSDD